MITKILVGLTIAVLSGGLVFGAINRTTARFSDGGTTKTSEGSRDDSRNGLVNLPPKGEGAGNDQRTSENRTGEEGYSSGAEDSSRIAESEAGLSGDVWFDVSGVVESVDSDSLVIRISDGSRLELSRRPWWFAQAQGFAAAPGDQVTLTGFLEEDEFKAASLDNLTSGFSTTIRDGSGRPLWAGNGG